MNLDVFGKIIKNTHHTLSYKTDQVVFDKLEYWRSWKDEVIRGETDHYDDCDGYALTMAELCVAFGAAKEDVAICYCAIEYVDDSGQTQFGGHLAMKCRIGGTWYYADCNGTTPKTRSSLESQGYVFNTCMSPANPGVWVKDV